MKGTGSLSRYTVMSYGGINSGVSIIDAERDGKEMAEQ